MKREKSLPKIYWKSGKEPCRNSGDENLNKWDEECIRKYGRISEIKDKNLEMKEVEEERGLKF